MAKLTEEHKKKLSDGRQKAKDIELHVKTCITAISKQRSPKKAVRTRLIEDRLKEMPPNTKKAYCTAVLGKSRVAGVKAFCQMCVGWDGYVDQIRECTGLSCPLYPYRPYK
jgi:hypothetical protein